MFALAVVADSDMVAALPRRFVALHAARFGVIGLEAPLSLKSFRLNAVATEVALMDAGVAWLFDMLRPAERVSNESHKRIPGRKRRH
jgi:hypothetical protein